MKRKVNISPIQIQKLVKRIIKEDAGKDTPGGNPEYFYGDGSLEKLRNNEKDSPGGFSRDVPSPGDGAKYGRAWEDREEIKTEENNNIIKNISYKGGQLVLEHETMFGPPKYMIYFDTEEDDTSNKIVAELDPDFFDEQMATTILDYIKTRE
tara:strand:+ start:639 stop:1094 length:456 start_codon:yes stop_codon:yes gene_type:complete